MQLLYYLDKRLVWCSVLLLWFGAPGKFPIDLDFRQTHKYSYCCISAMIPDSKPTQRAVEFCEMFDRKRLKGQFWKQFLVVNVFGRAIPKFPCVIALLMIQNTFPDVCIFILGVKLCILFERLIVGTGKRKPIQRTSIHFSKRAKTTPKHLLTYIVTTFPIDLCNRVKQIYLEHSR